MSYVYQMDNDERAKNTNKALNVVVEGLRIEGFLTKEQADEIHTHYSLILESKSWLPEFLANWLGTGDGMTLRLVKAVGREKVKGKS